LYFSPNNYLSCFSANSEFSFCFFEATMYPAPAAAPAKPPSTAAAPGETPTFFLVIASR